MSGSRKRSLPSSPIASLVVANRIPRQRGARIVKQSVPKNLRVRVNGRSALKSLDSLHIIVVGVGGSSANIRRRSQKWGNSMRRIALNVEPRCR